MYNNLKKFIFFYKFWTFYNRMGAFFVKDKYFLWWGLRPRPWAGPGLNSTYINFFLFKKTVMVS